MSRAVSLVSFLSIALGLLGGVHYYFWLRLVHDVAPPAWLAVVLTIVLVALCAAMPVSFWLSRAWPRERARPVLMVTFSWLGLMLFLLVLLGASELVLAVREHVAHASTLAGAQALGVARLRAGAVLVTAALAGVAAVRSGLGEVALRELEVELARLPRQLDGFAVVQWSDVHVGPTIGRDFVESLVARTNALDPDVVVITGDLVDGSVRQLREAVEPLRELRARHGVYFVTGNHEYYSNAPAWCRELTELGVRVLRNERVSLGNDDASFDLAGIDDYSAHQFGHGHGADLSRALEGRNAERELLLLAHQPRAIFEAAERGVGLQLSGHTHGGQLWPWNYLVRLQQPFVSGLSRVGRSLLYVSNGTGYWGPPMRLFAPAEITRVRLRSARA